MKDFIFKFIMYIFLGLMAASLTALAASYYYG
jgi:hypothetical protein